jgi:quercetin dioxygenase-like cupin family protein
MSHAPVEFITWSGLPQQRPVAGISGSVQLGSELSAALFRLEPGAEVPRHTHPNEEFGQVLEGTLELRAGDRTRALAAGDGFLIPGDLPHAATAGADGCLLLECYAPARDPFGGPATGADS